MKKYSMLIFTVIITFISCNIGPQLTKEQQAIVDKIEGEKMFAKLNGCDRIAYDANTNTVVFYSVIHTTGTSPAFKHTIADYYRNEQLVRENTRIFSFSTRYFDKWLFSAADAKIRIFIITDQDNVLVDETYSKDEYFYISKDERIAAVKNNLRQEVSSMRKRLPIFVEDGIVVVDVDFNSDNSELIFYFEVSDELLSESNKEDLQYYTDENIGRMSEYIYKLSRTNLYKEAGVINTLALVDKRGNILCYSSKEFDSKEDVFTNIF